MIVRVPAVDVVALTNACERAIVEVVPHGPVDPPRLDAPWRRIELVHRFRAGAAYVVTVNADVTHLAMNPPHLPTAECADEGARVEARSSVLVGLRNLLGRSGSDEVAAVDAELTKSMNDVGSWHAATVAVDGSEAAALHVLDVGAAAWCAYGEVAGVWAGIYAIEVSLDNVTVALASTMSFAVTQ